MSGNGSLSRRRRQNPLINSAAFSFRFGWLVLVVWNEVGQFYWSVSSCRWSKLEKKLPKILPTSSRKRPRATRILLISDPQLIDFHSPSFRRKPWKTAITEFVVDTYLKKSWSVAKKFKPDAVFFLGDQLDSGRATLSDAEFKTYAARFKHIFSTPHDLRVFYIPGNRDVGLGTSRSFSPHARDRYQQYFGAVNQEVTLGNHTFVMLDAPGLIEEDYRRYAAEVRFGEWDGQDGGSIEFLQRLGNAVPKFPRILLSHVPLTRRERVECGPNREGGGFISNGAGLGYQKLLGAETSTFLMEKVKPTLIFSGDDHDHCDYTHPNSVREVSVKTFSMAMGMSTPGFQILSLVPPNPLDPTAPSHADMACNLPNQLGIYFNIYVPCTVLTLLVLFFLNAKKSYRRRRLTPLNILTAPSSGSNTPMRHSSTPLIGSNPLKSPRLGSNVNLGMTPFASPNPTRRSSRSMPPSPTASPRLGYHPSTTEPQVIEEPSSFSVDAGPSLVAGISNPTRPSSFYLAGFHAAASQVDIEYDERNNNNSYSRVQSPSTAEEGGPSYFLPLPRTSSGIGLGLLSPTTPGGSGSGSGSGSTSSRPGQIRKVSRILEKENTLLPSTTRASRGEFIGIKEVLVDLRRAIGVPRKVWGLLGGEEALAARWLKDVLSVFWPAWIAYVVVNLCYR